MLAREIFGGIKADRLLLEYDERSGTFEPLHHVSEGKIVVLGPVTAKTSYRETVEELEACVRQATRYFPLERLSISPQCGFSTSVVGNVITVEDEQHKLRTLVETAERIWG